MSSISKYKVDKLEVLIYQNRKQLGMAAAHHVGALIKKVLKHNDEARIIFAAAASQREFFTELLNAPDIEWKKVIAFHMDEYHTLPTGAPQRFGNFLNSVFFRFIDFKEVYYMTEDLPAYKRLISEKPIDICCLGIGENGHLAFNDPPVADFNDPEVIKEVELDEVCRQQQVNDGEFNDINDVPKRAVTLTVPSLLNSKYLSVVVPGHTKANAVEETLLGEISTRCPASILRTHPNAKLFLDTHSSKLLKEVKS